MIQFIKNHKPPLITLATLILVTALCLLFSVVLNQKQLVYTHDDAYIHMTIAKNFSQYGVWGVTKHNFTSSSSSPLWTLLLSLLYYLSGVSITTPLILNVIVAVILTITAYIFLKEYKLPDLLTCVALLSLLFLVPFVPLIFTGMEHLLHLLITIVIVYLTANILSSKDKSQGQDILLLLITPFLVMTRYESLFLIFVIACMFLVKKRIFYAITLAAMAVLPVIVYGLISVKQGWYFLPNSVLLKGTAIDFHGIKGIIRALGYCGYERLLFNPSILLLFIMVFLSFVFQINNRQHIWDKASILAVIFLVVTPIQMQFAGRDVIGLGGYYRYDSYIIGLGILALFAGFSNYFSSEWSLKLQRLKTIKNITLIILILFMFSPLISRGFYTLFVTPQATKNIYEQQCQMGLFLQKFYKDKTVAVNDIGATTYFTDIRLFDLAGLASIDVAKAIKNNSYNQEKIRELATNNDVKIAIAYEHWYARYGGLPQQWEKVGTWTIRNNVICGGPTVSFYAVDPAQKHELMNNLEEFAPLLPKDVILHMIKQ